MKLNSKKYIRMALENGYTRGLGCSYSRDDDERYSLVILDEYVCLLYDVSDTECEGLATSRGYNCAGSIFIYRGIPVDILMAIALGPVVDIRKKLYEYDLNRNLEVLR